MVLTYANPSASGGKSTAVSDVVEARFMDIIPGRRVAYAVDFVSDDPAYAGTMLITWELVPVEGGTRVDITADDVPDGVRPDDHASGMNSSLMNLARYLEAWTAGGFAGADRNLPELMTRRHPRLRGPSC
jgi:hypothetical protein